MPPKIYYATTNDGWRIALHRHQARRGKYPVLLVHGLASNYRNMDFPIKELSLARYLKSHGLDTWIVDLRGSGLSKKKGFRLNRWYVDDFLLKDLPAAVQLIAKTTKTKKIHWIGHSLGGALGFAFAKNYQRKNTIRSLVTIGTPISTKAKGYFQKLFRFGVFLKLLPFMPYKILSRWASYLPHFMLHLDNHGMFSRENMNSKIFKTISSHAVENIPSSLYLQIHDWFLNEYFASKDKKINYQKQIFECDMPTLVIAGAIDSFYSKNKLEKDFKKLSAERKSLLIFGKEKGYSSDYGHMDLILGKNAPREVYPHILDWIHKHD